MVNKLTCAVVAYFLLYMFFIIFYLAFFKKCKDIIFYSEKQLFRNEILFFYVFRVEMGLVLGDFTCKEFVKSIKTQALLIPYRFFPPN